MKRIGIYSGTFDPVHAGHLVFAHEALRQCGLDKVFFLVEPRPRRKQGVKALEHRVEMVKLAISNEPKFGSIALQQQRFTAVDTLPVLRERFKGAELFMLMGDDALAHFADWPHVEDLVAHIHFAIGLRHHDKYETERKIYIIQRTRGFAMNHTLFQAPEANFSSSKIRQAIKKGQSPKGVPEEVLNYARREGLYDARGSSSKS